MIWGPCLPPPAPPTKDRIKKCVKGSSYLCKKGVRYWNGQRLKDKMKDRAYDKAHKEESKAYDKARYEANKEEIKARSRAYKGAHKEKVKVRQKAYKPQRNKLRRERWKTDEIYKLKGNLGSGLCNALKAQGASKNNRRTLEFSCCDVAFLYAHLENQFTDGMTWANWSINGWHIDHRRPKKSFNLQNEEEIYMMQHWTNLQPMWGPENIAKGADYDPETFTHE